MMDTKVFDQQTRGAEIAVGATPPQFNALVAVSKQWKKILQFSLCMVIVSAIVSLLLPSNYTAETVVVPPTQNSSVSSALMGQLAGSASLASLAGSSFGIRNPGDLYVALFQSRTVEDAMVKRFGLMAHYQVKRMSDARRFWEEHSTVLLGAKDGLIRISVTDHDPKFAAAAANGLVDEFRNYSANLAVTEASQRRVFFQQQLLEANENLAVAEEAMKHTEQTTGVLQADSQARTLIESAAALRAQVVAKQVQLKALLGTYATKDNPQVILVEQELAELLAQLTKLGGTDTEPNADIIVHKGNLPQAGIEYLRRVRDLKYYETIADLIAKQYEIAKLDEARQGTLTQVADIAISPDKKSSPHRLFIVLSIAISSFGSAIFWAILFARWQAFAIDPENAESVSAIRRLILFRY